MSDGVRRFALRPADLDEARRAPLLGISFVPALRLREADLRQRFGAPAEQGALGDGVAVRLYPALGLSASEGRPAGACCSTWRRAISRPGCARRWVGRPRRRRRLETRPTEAARVCGLILG